mgnify:CR=1 FL=1
MQPIIVHAKKYHFIWAILLCVTIAALAVPSYALTDRLLGLMGKEFTGTVLDHETKQPIEGAYVIAMYSIVRAGPAAVTAWCVKTKGMTTGKDGKFHFPIAELDGLPPDVSAIKPDYFLAGVEIPRAWNRSTFRGWDVYQGWDVYLSKQNPDKPNRRISAGNREDCWYATTRVDAAASVEFLKLSLEEFKKYVPLENRLHEGILNRIRHYEALPSKQK